VGPDPQAVTKPKAAKPRSSRYEAADYSAAVEGCIREIQRSISKDPDERREANVHHYRADIVAHAEQILRQRGILPPTAPEQNGQTAVSHPKKYPRRDDRFLPGYGPRVKEDLKIVNALLKAFRYPRQTDTEAYLREQAGDALYERAFKLAARKAVEKAAAEKHRADIKAHFNAAYERSKELADMSHNNPESPDLPKWKDEISKCWSTMQSGGRDF
jgi:hypothetical protein